MIDFKVNFKITSRYVLLLYLKKKKNQCVYSKGKLPDPFAREEVGESPGDLRSVTSFGSSVAGGQE